MIYVGQEGRPVHPFLWKDGVTERLKGDLGWSAQYISKQDQEAERLFNFGMMAPAPAVTPVDVFTCFDSRLAGIGSPRVVQGERPELIGHGKRLFVTNMVRQALRPDCASLLDACM